MQAPVQGAYLALSREGRSTPLPSEAEKIIIISETFRFSLPKYFSRDTTLKERHRKYGLGDTKLQTAP